MNNWDYINTLNLQNKLVFGAWRSDAYSFSRCDTRFFVKFFLLIELISNSFYVKICKKFFLYLDKQYNILRWLMTIKELFKVQVCEISFLFVLFHLKFIVFNESLIDMISSLRNSMNQYTCCDLKNLNLVSILQITYKLTERLMT